jgi:hypothetical protein
VKFEGGLSSSILANRATRYKKRKMEIETFLKKKNVFTLRHWLEEFFLAQNPFPFLLMLVYLST